VVANWKVKAMTKKSERIKFIVGCRDALNHNATKGQDGKLCYNTDTIKSVLATLDAVLKIDGISSIPANSKVGP
jgi:hypothetical protein